MSQPADDPNGTPEKGTPPDLTPPGSGQRDPAIDELMESVMQNAGEPPEGDAPADVPQLNPVDGDAMTLDEALAALAAAEAAAAEAREGALRATAESDNVRKRSQREVERARQFGAQKLAEDLLPVLDALQMGIESTPDEPQFASLRQGSEMVLGMLVATGEKHGLTQVNPVGEPFNPELHEALAMVEGHGDAGMVVTVHQPGYQLNGRLVRAAKVVVSQ